MPSRFANRRDKLPACPLNSFDKLTACRDRIRIHARRNLLRAFSTVLPIIGIQTQGRL